MADVRSKLDNLYTLEQFSAGSSAVHRLHPLVKILVTVAYLICIVSFDRYTVTALLPYLLYVVIMLGIADIPYNVVFKRVLIALPFCLFIGISNMFFDRQVVFELFGMTVTAGMVSLISILLKTILCVSVVLILIAVTPIASISKQLRQLRVPEIFVSLLEMTYRYIGVLLEDAIAMITAYRLRSNGRKWPKLSEIGFFIGQLLLRSMDRAERVYNAMKCRCYSLQDRVSKQIPLKLSDWVFFGIGLASAIVFRFVNVPVLLGGLF